jgi:hypothetical protein
MLALAEWAREGGRTIPSTISGRSMLPTLAPDAGIAIDPRDREFRRGAIVAVLSGNTVVAHRLIGRGRGRSARDYWITRGDACLVPDPPVSASVVIGRVHLPDGSEPPAEPRRQFVTRVFLFAIAAALEIDIRLARLLTRALSTVQSIVTP